MARVGEAATGVGVNASTLTAQDRQRLSSQCAMILARLERGHASNAELASISLKYTGRISELRAAGYCIECQRAENGLRMYALVPRVPASEPVQQKMFGGIR